MTYSSAGLIEASDYNGFANDTSNANVNAQWGAGATDKGYGQSTTLASVSAAGTVTATSWAALCARITSMASHTSTAITSRTSPSTSDTVTILAALNTDLTNLHTNRGNAAASGSQFTGWSGTTAKTGTTGSGAAAWTLTFTHTIEWSSAAAARYFFNAGGLVKWETSKTADSTAADTEWNDLANTLVGDIYISGGTATQRIAGSDYTGTTKVGGTGTATTLTTTTGWYDLTTSDTEIYKQFADTSPYTGSFIKINAKTAGSGTQLVLTTVWTDPGGSGTGSSDDISGGTAPSGVTPGSAPATIVSYYPPSATYLTEQTWGNATVLAAVATS